MNPAEPHIAEPFEPIKLGSRLGIILIRPYLEKQNKTSMLIMPVHILDWVGGKKMP
jgi:hypothetical protein